MPATTPLIGTLDLSGLPESDRLAFYGALFSMSAADDKMVESETDRIFQSLDLGQLSAEARKELFAHGGQPPASRTLHSRVQGCGCANPPGVDAQFD